MTVDLAVRLLCLLLSAFVGGMALTRAVHRRDVYRWVLLSLAAYALAAVYGQITLLDQPLTTRTAASFAAAVVGTVWAVLLLVRKPPPDKGKGR